MQVLAQIPVLWIWDNVEQVAGFPSGTASSWSADEQRELADFLRAARDSATTSVKPKFLLTSRRDERSWLGELPARITVPPMPFLERVELARALAEKHGQRLTDVQDWRPLLQFTQGNPMTLTVLLGQALRDRLRTRQQIEAFVSRLRAGEAVFKDEVKEGRTRSLAAALNYGFENAFSDGERRQLALLHLFQGFVDVDALKLMGNPKNDWHLPELRGLDREAGMALLDRTAEVGLLTAYGDGYYSIHPALPWFFKKMFDEYYAGSQAIAERAFVEVVGELGDYYADQYTRGARDATGVMQAEETNLLHARRLARSRGWWGALIGTMQSLMLLYRDAGRRAEWARLVEEIVPDFTDSVHGGSLPGREEYWSLVGQYQVRLAREARQWAKAERLQTERAAWDRHRASAALTLPPENLDAEQRHSIRMLATSMHELAEIQREMNQPECVESYNQSYDLALLIDDKPGAGIVALNLGKAYQELPAIHNLDKAEYWYRRSLELRPENDRPGKARALGQVGSVELARFLDARRASKPAAELLAHLNKALQLYTQVLELSHVIEDLAVTHNQIGLIHYWADDLERALMHFSRSIGYYESAGNLFEASRCRASVALVLAQGGRLADAKEYAVAALRNFQTYGASAAQDVQDTLKLIADIDKDAGARADEI